MTNDEASSCNICLHELLSKDVCALNCGHLYHHECVVNWLGHKSSCPLCKKPNGTEDVRPLSFDFRAVSGAALEEERRLEDASREECELRFQELSTELSALAKVSESLEQELSPSHAEARRQKLLRSQIVQKIPEMEEQLQHAVARALEVSMRNATMQVTIDAEAPHLQRRQPVQRPREDDADLREERRKMASGCKTNRVRQLHSSLLAAWQQDVEVHRRKSDREAARKETEDQLKGLRREESKFRRQLEERKASSDSLASASSTASLEKSLTIGKLDVPVEIVNAAAEAQDQEDDMLYGPSAKIARKSTLGRGALPSDSSMSDHRGKPNTLFGQGGNKATQTTKALLLQRRDSKIGQSSQDFETSSQVSSAPSTNSKASTLTIEKLDIPVEIVSLAPEVSVQDEEDDTDMLYGGTSLKRKRTLSQDAYQSASSAKGVADGSKRGALFAGRCGSGNRPAVATPAIAMPVSREPAQSLFDGMGSKRGALFTGRCGSGTRPAVATPAIAMPVSGRPALSTMQSLFARRKT